MMGPAIRLDPHSATPIYAQIYERVRGAILNGTLPPGARLPSWNALASELGVARGTVKQAYDWLAGEGYVFTQGAAGTRVHAALDPPPTRRSGLNSKMPVAEASASAGPSGWQQQSWGAAPRLFQLGVPAIDDFPRSAWARLAGRHMRHLVPETMVYQDPAGYPPLRESIARYLAMARGIACDATQIFITAGYTGALDLVTRTVLAPQDRVWIEDPVYPRTREALSLAGVRIVPVPVDDEGLVVARGIAAAREARFAVVTASHQAPLGMPLSLPRRLALLAWAAGGERWIIEDDYYGEFQYRGRPVPALKSLDQADRVFYIGTFSKVLMPSLRLGYVVAPAALVPKLTRIATCLVPSQSLLAQMTVADFIAEGHFARHIRRMRRLYRERRAALVAALEGEFGGAWQIGLQESGMHLLARLPAGSDDVALACKAAASGLGLIALSAWAVKADCGAGLLLGFANIPARDAPRAVAILARALSGKTAAKQRS
jgi:GntR family transcriptional regulator / MocR family aminotransferase